MLPSPQADARGRLPATAAAAAPQRLPLATQPTPLTDFSTATLLEWERSAAAHSSGKEARRPVRAADHSSSSATLQPAAPDAKHIKHSTTDPAGPLAVLVLAALLLLVFMAWRLARCCASCCCPSRRPGLLQCGCGHAAPNKPAAAAAAARRILRGCGARSLKATLLLCALGTLVSCIYGLTQRHTTIVAGTLSVLRQAETLAGAALAVGDRLLLSLAELGNATQALSQQLEAAGPAYTPLTQQPLQQLGSSSEQLGAAAAGLQDVLSTLRPATLGMMQHAEASYLPLARSGETLWVLGLVHLGQL